MTEVITTLHQQTTEKTTIDQVRVGVTLLGRVQASRQINKSSTLGLTTMDNSQKVTIQKSTMRTTEIRPLDSVNLRNRVLISWRRTRD